MAGNFKVSMTLTADDKASRVIQKGVKDTQRAATAAETAVNRLGSAQRKNDQQNARSARTAAEEARRAAQARETLGIRSEKNIQREIDRTIASYNRLARTGTLSAREQARAYEAMTGKVRRLREELGSVNRLGQLWRNGAAITGGIAAATAVVARPVAAQMSYERRLSGIANSAFSDDGQAGRLAGRQRLADTIRRAVTYGGGSKEDAADTLDLLLSNKVHYETADKWLGDLLRTSTATGVSARELVPLAIKARDNFGISENDIPKAIQMVIAAGKAGSVDFATLISSLPSQISIAKDAGLYGLDDFSLLLALNETAAIGAGSDEAAASGVASLLSKINNKAAAAAASRVQINGNGIDLLGTLTAAREKGINPIEAFSKVVDQVIGNDARYQDLQKKLSTTTNSVERNQVLESMSALLESGGIGQILSDKAALSALLAYRNNPEFRQQVEDIVNRQRTLPAGQRVGDEDYAFIASTNDFKLEQARNIADFAQMDAVGRLADATGSAAAAVAEFGAEFPELTAAAAGATLAIKSMTAAAIAFAGINLLTGASRAAATAAAGSTAAGAAAASGGGVAAAVGRLLGVGGAVTGFATITSAEEDAAILGSDARWAAIRARYPQSVIDAARKRYQPWYQFGPGYSTENERWIEQYLADEQGINALLTPEQVLPAIGSADRSTPAQTAASPLQPATITTQLVVDSQVLAEAVNQYNILDAYRSTGGGD